MSCYNCIIRNPKSGLVLQAKESRVLLENFNGFNPQKWQVTPVGIGLNMIVNKANGEALDIDGNAAASAKVVTSPVRGRTGDDKQHWYVNSDSTIANAANGKLVLDVDKNQLVAGAFIIVYTKSGDANQKFEFECE